MKKILSLLAIIFLFGCGHVVGPNESESVIDEKMDCYYYTTYCEKGDSLILNKVCEEAQ